MIHCDSTLEQYDNLGIKPHWAATRAVWAAPLPSEPDAPAHRIIHQRVLRLQRPTKLFRLGIQPAAGYHKCGSRQDLDWVKSLRLLTLDTAGKWQVVLTEERLPQGMPGKIHWFDLDIPATAGVIIEVRRCGIDEWWPSWNLVSGAFVLEGETPEVALRREKTHSVEKIQLESLPVDIKAQIQDGEVRYKTPFFQVGFALNRGGFTWLSLDDAGAGNTTVNLLRPHSGIFYSGPMLHPLGQAPTAAPSLHYQAEASTRILNNHVEYKIEFPAAGQTYFLHWEILADRMRLKVRRKGEKSVRAWHSSAWMLGLQPTVCIPHVIGDVLKKGETGIVKLPALLHAPGNGTFQITADSGDVLLRADANRPADLSTFEIKLGEIPQAEGDYLLPAGDFEAEIEFKVVQAELALKADTPKIIRDVLRKTTYTAMTFRPDTATLTNNGISMHCPICMDMWADVITRLPEFWPGFHPIKLLQDSLERWLEGAPGYTSGHILQDGAFHEAEDEYLMTGAACLLGLAEYLKFTRNKVWFERYRDVIARQISLLKQRDIDGDGLIESSWRTGVSGTQQWASCWWDVISFGWKCAFSNALLFDALNQLQAAFELLDASEMAAGLDEWAGLIRQNYVATFYNEKTGWLAGWRCKEDKLHDHAFLFINGAAISKGLVDAELSKSIMSRLWQEMQRVGVPNPTLGLPGNLWHIPDEDLSDIMQGFPMGYYQNGGRTSSQARHFVNALYRVGMENEARALLLPLCDGLARAETFGGNKCGRDWRYWDDRTCGYEGLLTDQFGILATALEHYRK